MTAQIAAYGRIVADVQTKATSNGSNMAFTRMAVSLPCREAEDGSAVMWLGVTAFGKQADALAAHNKGDVISVSGPLQVRQWTGQGGEVQSGYSLVADSVVSAKTVRPGAGNKRSAGKADQSSKPPAQAPTASPPTGGAIDDDEPPF